MRRVGYSNMLAAQEGDAKGRRKRMGFDGFKDLMRKTLVNWGEDNVPRLSAAFSFYAMLSLSPVLILAVAAASLYLGGNDAAHEHIRNMAAEYLGKAGAEFLDTLTGAKKSTSGMAALLGILVAFYGASNLFLQLDEAANAIWGIKQSGPFFRNFIVGRVGAFLMVVIFGGALLAWIAVDSWLGWISRISGGWAGWQYVSLLVTVLFLTAVLAIVYKTLPKGMVAWGDVWVGAFVAALGFALSKFLLSMYFKYSGVAAAYGSAGALVVILLWIYYASQIFFFGFEITNTFACAYGSHKDKQAGDLRYS